MLMPEFWLQSKNKWKSQVPPFQPRERDPPFLFLHAFYIFPSTTWGLLKPESWPLAANSLGAGHIQ